MSSTSPNRVSDALAEAAIAPIQSGMVVGLGTGRTASRGILALAERIKEESLDIKVVATSHVTETLARQLQLNLVDFMIVQRVDYLFDGADEVDGQLRMIKGGGGAMTRERVVAACADRRVYMVSQAKMVEHLGEGVALPIAIHAFGMESIRHHLRSLGLNGVMRRSMNGEYVLNDQGNLIVDVSIKGWDLDELAAVLDSMPGVVDHGLFLYECDELMIETPAGIQHKMRPEPEHRGSCGQGCGCH